MVADFRNKINGVTTLLTNAQATQTGPWVQRTNMQCSMQATVVGSSGTQTATVAFDVSNDGKYACDTVAGTITLSGSLNDTDGFVMNSPWPWVRARITAISGTGATVNVTMGE